jgi:alpha-glucosidase
MDEPNERSPLTIVCEYIFLGSSTILIADRAWAASPVLCLAYLAFLLLYAIKMVRITPPRGTGSPSPLAIINAFAFTTIVLARVANGSPSAAIMAAAAAPTGHKEIAVPSAADNGIPRLPTIKDPMAKDAQKICPGYLAKNVKKSDTGITATLQLNGKHCQAYGNDIDTLALSVSYQAQDRLNVKIQPANIPDKEYWWYILPEFFTPSPPTEPGQGNATLNNDLSFYWNNDPTFNFRVVRDSTGDVLFDTSGNKLVYEDQFIEFVTHMPANYNLYGLGETIHGFRLGNNFTKVS